MTAAVQPVRRDLKFRLGDDQVTRWNWHGNLHVTQYFNTLSLFFPEGERFFIDSVRAYRDRVKDNPELSEAVRAFIGQEAMHGREHDEYNDKLQAAGVPVKSQERVVTRLLKTVQRTLPTRMQLAATIALEHYTAILADILLREPELLEGADEKYAALWRWHALEETEHKAVAFDLYEAVFGRGPVAYAERTFAMLLATVIFLSLLYPFYFENVRRKGGLFDLKGWWSSVQLQFGRPGALRKVFPAWLDWFRPGFHPWDHDNRHFLEMMDEMLEVVRRHEEAEAA